MIYIFDMDGTLTEPWYGEISPMFYASDYDMSIRSYIENTYKYVKVLPYVKKFIEENKTYYEKKGIEFKMAVASRIVSGKEYMDKVRFLKENLGFEEDAIFGAVNEEQKLDFIKFNADKDKVVYFDDTVSTLNLVKRDISAKNYIMVAHSTTLLTRSAKEIHTSYITESSAKDLYDLYLNVHK